MLPPPPSPTPFPYTTLFRSNAVVDSVVSIRTPTPWGDWHSLAVPSHGEYNVPDGLQFGFPVRSDGEHWEVVPDLKHRSEEHTSELQSRFDLVCRLLLEKKKH